MLVLLDTIPISSTEMIAPAEATPRSPKLSFSDDLLSLLSIEIPNAKNEGYGHCPGSGSRSIKGDRQELSRREERKNEYYSIKHSHQFLQSDVIDDSHKSKSEKDCNTN